MKDFGRNIFDQKQQQQLQKVFFFLFVWSLSLGF